MQRVGALTWKKEAFSNLSIAFSSSASLTACRFSLLLRSLIMFSQTKS